MRKNYILWPYKLPYKNSYGEQSSTKEYLRSFRSMNNPVEMQYVYYGDYLKLSGCLSSDDYLYVVGHGGIGYPYISNAPDGGENVSAQELCARLQGLGLLMSSSCKIKIFTCYSGLGDPGFAMSMVAELRSRGYSSVSVYGYIGAVTPYMDKHKLCFPFAFMNNFVSADRASLLRCSV